MELFTIKDILNAVPGFFDVLGSLKDAFASAVLSNVGSSFHIFTSGNWIVGGLMLAGSLVMVWRLKGWIIGLLGHVFFRH